MKTARLISVIIVMMLCSSCIHFLFEKPTVVLKSIKARPTLQGMEIRFGVEVTNPNGYDLKLESLNFNFQVNEEGSGSARIESPILLPAKSAVDMEVPLITDMKILGKVVSALIRGRELKYRIEGDALVKAALGEKNFHFLKEGLLSKQLLE